MAHTHSTSGYHEVVIESPSHAPLLPYHPRVHVERVLEMCRDRVAQLEGRVGVASVTLFENTGPESGGSLWHPHAQLVATVALPPELATELEGSGQYREEHGVSCAFEQVRDDELRDGLRAVHGDEWFDVFAPFASAFPYELRVVPRRHAASFSAISPNEVTALAELLPQLLKSLLAIIPGASYNLLVRAPVATISGADSYHWHLDICPRLLRPDGFDLASGFHVNTVPPEDAASRYRAAMGAKP